MRKASRAAAIVLAVASALASGAGVAGALRSIELSRAGTLKTDRSPVTFSGSGLQVTCQLVLEGTVNRAIAKSVGSAAGSITLGTAERCTNFGNAATATILAEARTPWQMGYQTFLGTLPNVIGVAFRLTNVRVLIATLGTGCLFRGGVLILGNGEQMTSLTFLSEALELLVTLLTGLIMCPAEMSITGSMRLEIDSQREIHLI